MTYIVSYNGKFGKTDTLKDAARLFMGLVQELEWNPKKGNPITLTYTEDTKQDMCTFDATLFFRQLGMLSQDNLWNTQAAEPHPIIVRTAFNAAEVRKRDFTAFGAFLVNDLPLLMAAF